ncbi:uncharacterized protein LOC144638391 [Oculina patagonica]
MERGTITDNQIIASSAIATAKNGRLNFASGSSWCAATSDTNPYLQIDLQTLNIICAVSTQGNSQADQWVKNYTLQSSTDGLAWTEYKEGGRVKILKGNEDRDSEVKHILYEGVLARYLRFLPETQQGGVCMRAEVFGVKLKPENLALGRPTNQSSTYSNEFIGVAESGRAVDGNPDTNMRNLHCSHTGSDNPSWWRVDLGSDHVPVSEIHIVNRFGIDQEYYKDFKITLGDSTAVTSNTRCKGLYTFFNFKASAVCLTDPLKTGRYVGIMTTRPTPQSLQLCEVEVYSRENLAFGKQTNQSSTDQGGVSSRGVDGNSATNYNEASCTLTQSENNPWWRVDLGQVEAVSEVYIVNRDSLGNRLSHFEIRVGTISSGGGVINPKCGGTYGVPGGKGLSFFCRPPLYGRYVTIRSLTNEPLTLCEVEVYSERRACPMQAIGVASSYAFPDNSFSASSSSSGNEAFKGRLDNVGAWSPNSNNDASDYLQIDLKYEFVICAVATQGKETADHWTTKYKIRLSLTGSNNDWITYQENNVDKVFNGNSRRNDVVKHSLKEYASARFIRFQPTEFSISKALRVEVFGILLSAVPSQAPSDFTVTASTSTSITASWQLPPENSRHGIITGFKLFYQKKGSAGPPTTLNINNGASRSENVTNLDKYTEYEFQMLAFTSVGDGPKSSAVVERTKEDAPGAPATFSHIDVAPSKFHGPRILLTWSRPSEENGIIRNYTLFYNREKDLLKETFGSDVFSYSVDVLSGVTYQFHVRAVTIKPGENASLTVNIPAYDKPVIEELPERVILSVGKLAVLTCEVSGNPEPSVTWTKNGNASIPRAQFKNDGRILVIPHVLPGDSGVYECKASNALGENRTSTTVIVAVPPSVNEHVSPPLVICERQTLCSLFCQATSDFSFNYSWTKSGQVPVGDHIKIFNNSFVLTPRDAKDYGVYVCHATNSFGSTAYRITLSEGHKRLTTADTMKGDNNVNSTFNATVIALSCFVFLSLVVNAVLIWRLRRAVSNNRTMTTDKTIIHDIGKPDLPRDQHVSVPDSYMELRPRPSEGHSFSPPDFKSAHDTNKSPGYYNLGLNKGNDGNDNEETYEEIMNDYVYPKIM